jgi:RNA polymerase sigma-70 factor (ECF subfamily)
MATNIDKYAYLAALLRAGLAGNNVDYAKFLSTITPLLRRVVSGRIAINDVEDVVQEILISIHKARHTYDGERPIMPWLMAIARFRLTDHLRKYYATMQHQTMDISDLEEVLPNLNNDVTESGEAGESVAVLLKGVPKKQQRILTMMHMEGYTAKEVGKQLDMQESAVKVAAHRALKKIREKFVP